MGWEVRQLRLEMGVNEGRMAKILGCDKQYIVRVEGSSGKVTGTVAGRLHRLRKLVKMALGAKSDRIVLPRFDI